MSSAQIQISKLRIDASEPCTDSSYVLHPCVLGSRVSNCHYKVSWCARILARRSCNSHPLSNLQLFQEVSEVVDLLQSRI